MSPSIPTARAGYESSRTKFDAKVAQAAMNALVSWISPLFGIIRHTECLWTSQIRRNSLSIQIEKPNILRQAANLGNCAALYLPYSNSTSHDRLSLSSPQEPASSSEKTIITPFIPHAIIWKFTHAKSVKVYSSNLLLPARAVRDSKIWTHRSSETPR